MTDWVNLKQNSIAITMVECFVMNLWIGFPAQQIFFYEDGPGIPIIKNLLIDGL